MCGPVETMRWLSRGSLICWTGWALGGQGFLLDNPLVARRLGISDIEIDQYPDLVN